MSDEIARRRIVSSEAREASLHQEVMIELERQLVGKLLLDPTTLPGVLEIVAPRDLSMPNRIVFEMVAKQAENRYPSLSEVAAALQTAGNCQDVANRTGSYPVDALTFESGRSYQTKYVQRLQCCVFICRRPGHHHLELLFRGEKTSMAA